MAKKEIDEKEQTKLEMLEYLKNQVNVEVSSAVKKAENRLLKHKNIVIFKKNVIIIFLLLVILGIGFYLYKDNYFDKFFKKNTPTVIPSGSVQSQQSNLIEEYAYLLDNIVLSENSKYLKDFYDGKLTDNIKLYLAMGLIDENDFDSEDEMLVLSEESFLKYYSELFDSNIELVSFDYNNKSVKYLKTQKLYLVDCLNLNKDTNIKRNILEVTKENEIIKITTVEALVKDGYIYNILDNKKIGKYNNNLEDYKNKLDIITYVFDSSKLISLSKS